LPARHATLKKVRNQLPGLAALVDFWWAGVAQDVEQAASSAPWRLGTRGRRSTSRPFSAPPRLSKAATALGPSSITISAAYQSGGTKCGQGCITSIAVPLMGRHLPRGFSDERFQTSLKPWVVLQKWRWQLL
jgi:hypothetical protein